MECMEWVCKHTVLVNNQFNKQKQFLIFLACLHKVHRPIVVTSVVRVYMYVRVTLSVKVFRSLYLLNMLMDQVDTLHVCRYWSEILCFYNPPERP